MNPDAENPSSALPPPEPVVSLQRCPAYRRPDVRAAMRRLLEPFGGMKAFVPEGARVLLKPNMIVPRDAKAAVTTHPEIVRAVALEVREAGGVPFIGDSPAFSSAEAVARACGIADIAQELDLEIVDLGKRPRLRPLGYDSPFPRTAFGAAALEAGVIINLPKIKTHCQMGMSLATKNLFGCVAGKRKAFLHFRNGGDRVAFGKMLVAVARFLNPALSIADGIVALERDGPTAGDPRETGVLAASADPTALDRVLIEIFGVLPESIPCLEAARQLEYGCQDLERIRIEGETIAALRVRNYVRMEKLKPIDFTLPRVIRSVIRHGLMLLQAKRRR